MEYYCTDETINNLLPETPPYFRKGFYRFIKQDAYFFVHEEVVAASSLGSHAFDFEQRNIAEFLPLADYPVLNLRSQIVTLAVSVEDEQVLRSLESRDVDANCIYQIVKKSLSSAFELPEITSTRSLLKRSLEDEFECFCDQKLLFSRDHALCKYGTSKPDFCFYHKNNFAINECVAAALVTDCDDDLNESPFVPYGTAGEDKNEGYGYSQAIAAMVLLATRIGKEAILKKRFFSKAVMFSVIREVKSTSARICKLTMDFQTRNTEIILSDDTESIQQCLSKVIHVLRNPMNILSVE